MLLAGKKLNNRRDSVRGDIGRKTFNEYKHNYSRKRTKKSSDAEDAFVTTNLFTGEIINYVDLENVEQRQEYIKLETSRSKLNEVDFEKKMEASSWKLLNMVTSVLSLEKIFLFLADQIQNPYDLDMTFENGRSYLVYVVARGDQVLLEKFIHMKPDLVNKPDDFGRTPLHYAVLFNKFKLMTILLASKAEVDYADKSFQTPLHLAASKNLREFYLFLKFKGANGKALDSFGMRPIDYVSVKEDYKQLSLMEGISDGSMLGLTPVRKGSTVSRKSTAEGTDNPYEEFNPEQRWLNKRKAYFSRLGILNQNCRIEGANIYHDFYGEHLAKKYYLEEKKRERRESKLFSQANDSVQNSSEQKESPPTENAGASLSSDEKSFDSDSPKTPSPNSQLHYNLPDVPTLKATDFMNHGLIGKGSFGEICCVSIKGQSTKYALKSYLKSHMLSNNIIRFLFVEKKIMTNFNHPFIVKMHYSFQSESKLYLIMEYCEKRDISKCIRKVTEHQIKILACELTLAIKAMHQQGMIHRDIKPENVLVAADGHIKLADFGLAKEKFKPGELAHTFCGSVAYLPPEVIAKSGHNKTIDWYLMGEILYEMMVGRPPFYEGNKETLYENILHKKLEFPEFGMSDTLKDLIAALLNRNIDKRLGSNLDAEEVMGHPYFVGIDWHKVYQKGYTLFEPSMIKSYTLQDTPEPLVPESGASPGLPPKEPHIELPFWSFSLPDTTSVHEIGDIKQLQQQHSN